jgi:NADPH:quinone reductase-like Zn-dependent oxidoreductase/acyl carrier protein
VRHEHPEIVWRLVDIETDADLEQEKSVADDALEVAWRDGERYEARLTPGIGDGRLQLPDAPSYALGFDTPGVLDRLRLAATTRTICAIGQAEVAIHASGLNFRDVLNVLGLYPGEAGPLGIEASGIADGQRVMGLVPGSMARYATVDKRCLVLVPDTLSLDDAATIPIAFLTAWYALHRLGGIQAGQRVLIHAAAGGVGMAAVQIARQAGALVFATASPAKWDLVRALGFEHVANSRTLDFVEVVQDWAPDGIDLVLNSLTGEAIPASLGLLKAGGLCLELGKRDVWTADRVAHQFPSARYQAFDMASLDLDTLAGLWTDLLPGFESGTLRPLPSRAFDITDAVAAFRHMAQGHHTGKVILRTGSIDPDGTYLVTGGLGALGRVVAEWLVVRGARHLVLATRHVAHPDWVAALGARVVELDVTQSAAVHALVADLPNLRGVIHAAGITDDGALLQQTPERMAAVIAPKADGAWNLHRATEHRRLDFFILFSSAAGLLGHAGQSNYAAANAALDALAAYRLAHGLPALSIAWGPWSIGMAAPLQERLRRQGIIPIEPAAARRYLDALIGHGGQVAVLSQRASATRPTPAVVPSSSDLLDRLQSASPEEQRRLLTDSVRQHVARTVALTPADVPVDKPLSELGLDSLMAVELRNSLSGAMGQTLPATLAFQYPTVEGIVGYLESSPWDDSEPTWRSIE